MFHVSVFIQTPFVFHVIHFIVAAPFDAILVCFQTVLKLFSNCFCASFKAFQFVFRAFLKLVRGVEVVGQRNGLVVALARVDVTPGIAAPAGREPVFKERF